MFETIEEILSVATGSVAFISALIGFIISYVKGEKNKKLAQTAEKTIEISELATDKVVEIEKLYSQAATVLKAVGVSTGAIKKENVMNYIESKCVEKGVAFDSEYWSEKVEKLVEVLNTNKK